MCSSFLMFLSFFDGPPMSYSPSCREAHLVRTSEFQVFRAPPGFFFRELVVAVAAIWSTQQVAAAWEYFFDPTAAVRSPGKFS